ncbi:MAG TPA: ferritin-like protein [Rhizomicrobium sp.]
MIRLRRSLIQGLTGPAPSPAAVRIALQQAVQLEHATIPVYLYGLYSLHHGTNREIAEIIQSVVVQEMLHMTLACNVLNAIGGSPQIDKPGFIPTYPGPLPGGVESGLIVSLAPFSMAQLQTYLDIEQPEDPINFPAALAAADEITIGQFYAAISAAIAALGNGIFVDPPRNQVGPDIMYESVVVTDVATAQQAIATIVEQGEGTTTSPLEVVGSGYAHYYRYMQIRKGRLLVPAPGTPDGYAYAGAPVPFDASGVYDVPPATAGSLASDNFNYSYTSLLGALHTLFNGHNDENQFNRALGLMMSLKGQAKAMMAGIPKPAAAAGPSFVYQPVNPLVPA